MRNKVSPFSISRDSRKRVSYFIFSVVFLCCIMNFMFMILPRILYPGQYMKVNQIPCNELNCDEINQNQHIEQKFEIEDEFSYIRNIREHDNMVNQKYCNGLKCKFLLAYYPPTLDTTTTDIEFLTYVKLAESLGRIMVLANVGPTRISTCQRNPFDLYYDMEKLQENYPNVKFISQHEFQKWSYQRIQIPTTSHYYITDGAGENTVNYLTPYSYSLKKVWCLDKFRLNLNDDTTIFKQLRASWNFWKVGDGRDILKSFLINNLQDETDVLLIRHDMREPIFKDHLPTLTYAKPIRDAALNIINSLRPYVAIHWDVGYTKDSALSICAPRLLNKTQYLIKETGTENIYFSSDYPLRYLNELVSLNSTKSVIRHSSKLRYISDFHTKTMELISTTIPYHTADSLGVIKNLEDTLKDDFESSGIRDIIDKLVSVEADWFIGSPQWPCNNPTDSKRSKVFVALRNKIWKDFISIENESEISKMVVKF